MSRLARDGASGPGMGWAFRTGLVGLCIAVGCAWFAGSADAALPWWHLNVGTRPSTVTPGTAENAEQVVSVSATGGEFRLERYSEEQTPATSDVAFNASAATVQSDLEKMYGVGNVVVEEGSQDTSELRSWTVKFEGELADQPIGPMRAEKLNLHGGEKKASVQVEHAGRSDGEIVLSAENVGDAAVLGAGAPVHLVDTLPAGVIAVGMSGWAQERGVNAQSSMPCSLATLTCTFSETLGPYAQIEIRIDIVVKGSVSGSDALTVSGGGAPPATAATALRLGENGAFGLESYEMIAEEEGGAHTTEAGSHPFQLTTTVGFNQTADLNPLRASKPQLESVGMAKDVRAELPPGLVGNPQPIARCSLAQFLTYTDSRYGSGGDECPAKSAVGVASITIYEPNIAGYATFAQPIFNLEPAYGEPVRFGFYVAIAHVPVLLDASLRSGPDEDYGITVTSPNISQITDFISSTVTFWGDPGDPRHASVRGWGCLEQTEGFAGFPCNPVEEIQPPALLTMPTACTGALPLNVLLDSWSNPFDELASSASEPLPKMQACSQLRLEPTIASTPTTKSASSPTGLGFQVNIDDEGITAPQGRAESQAKKFVVALPEGVTVNPAVAVGLVPCGEQQYLAESLSSTPGVGCPAESKIGEVEVQSPLLEQRLTGAVYLARQNENPFHSLLAFYVVVKNPEVGILIRLAGKVVPNFVTGQLVSTFENIPQLPFSHFELRFRQGQRSALVTPDTCGTYTTRAEVTPWSAPEETLLETSSFEVTSGVGGGACPAGGTPPFAPTVIGGASSNVAGSYSPFYIRIERKDGEQEITGFAMHFPPGLVGSLAGIPFCSNADIQRAREQTGAQAEADPACPAASQIGRTIAEAGVGTVLAQTPGRLYFAGPFEGAPFSVVDVTSAKVGAFDLGTVIVHLPLHINPVTAQVDIPSGPADQIPHIIDGIVIHVRTIRVYVEREHFIINPTSCEPMGLSATVIGAGANFADPAAAQPVTVTDRFQEADCANLKFAPSFKVSTSGKTSRQTGASLHVSLTYPKGSLGTDANVHYVKVDLPKQLPSNLEALKHACPAATFEANPAACDPISKVGTVLVHTQILPVPLEGPAYFVSYGGAKFPELVFVLQGYDVTVDVHAETFIDKAGITTSTIRNVPDVPFESFELNLPQRDKYSALAAPSGLCNITTTKTAKKKVRVRSKNGKTRTVTRKVKKSVAASLVMPTSFIAQNGAEIHQNTPIEVIGCPRAKKAKASKRGKYHGKKK